MKTNFLSPVRCLTAILILFAALPAAHAQVTNGFNKTAAGPFDYNDTANWVGTTINGLWDISLTNAATQTVTFNADTVLATGFTFNYAGNFALTLSGTNVNRTVTLGGDIVVNTAGGTSANVTLGSATAGKNLNVDLGGGTRTFTVAASRTLTFLNTISDGSFVVSGGGTVKLSGAGGAAANSNVTVNNGAIFMFDSSSSGVTGATRAQSLTLRGGSFLVNGNAGAGSVDTIANALNIDAPTDAGNGNIITLTPNAATNTQLTAGSLVRANHGTVLFRGTNLGASPIVDKTANTANIVFTTAPTAQLIGGGGAAGSTNISILPWAIGDTSTAGNGASFVTYDANGIRPLNTTTEYDTSIPPGASDYNVMLPSFATNTTINSDITMNSLFLQNNTKLAGTGKLTITSGAVFANYGSPSSVISNQLDFGSVEGVIGATGGANQGLHLAGGISGTNGVTFYTINRNSADAGILLDASCTYTGNTYVLGSVVLNVTNALPYGSRLGDVYVSGRLELNASATSSPLLGQWINGLNGTGLVYSAHSGDTKYLIVGDNNANGNFAGTISQFGKVGLTKVGTGTQILSGSNSSYTSPTTILGGILSVTTLADGGQNSSIGASPNTAGSLVISNATLQYTGGGAQIDRLFTLQAGGSTLVITSTVESAGSGALAFTNTGAIVLSGRGNRALMLSGSNTGDNTLAPVWVDGTGTTASTNSLVKSGSGKWVLNGINTYTGATTVNGGTLAVNGSVLSTNAALGGVFVNAGGTLGGTGAIVSAVTVANGGTLAPGNSAGFFTVGALTLASNANFAVELNGLTAGTGYDQLKVTTGAINLSNSVLAVTLGFTPNPGDLFTIVSNQPNVAVLGTFAGLTQGSTFNVGGTAFQISYTGNGVNDVVLTVVPEPGVIVLTVASLGLLLLVRRRRGGNNQLPQRAGNHR